MTWRGTPEERAHLVEPALGDGLSPVDAKKVLSEVDEKVGKEKVGRDEGEEIVDYSSVMDPYWVVEGEPLRWTEHALARAEERRIPVLRRVALGARMLRGWAGKCVYAVRYRSVLSHGDACYWWAYYVVAEEKRKARVITVWRGAQHWPPLGKIWEHLPIGFWETEHMRGHIAPRGSGSRTPIPAWYSPEQESLYRREKERA